MLVATRNFTLSHLERIPQPSNFVCLNFVLCCSMCVWCLFSGFTAACTKHHWQSSKFSPIFCCQVSQFTSLSIKRNSRGWAAVIVHIIITSTLLYLLPVPTMFLLSHHFWECKEWIYPSENDFLLAAAMLWPLLLQTHFILYFMQ